MSFFGRYQGFTIARLRLFWALRVARQAACRVVFGFPFWAHKPRRWTSVNDWRRAYALNVIYQDFLDDCVDVERRFLWGDSDAKPTGLLGGNE